MVSRTEIGTRMGRSPSSWGPAATGRREVREGVDWIVCERLLSSAPTRVWQLLTDPAVAASWLGTWSRSEGGVGYDFVALGDEMEPVSYLLSEVRAPRLLEVVMQDPRASGDWRLRLELTEHESGGTRLAVAQTVAKPSLAPSVGAACDYYLDRLVAVESGTVAGQPDFDDYFVSQAEHYRRLFPVQRGR